MKRLFPVICLFFCVIAVDSFAGSATWNANPVSGDWNTAANWTPATVPNGTTDVATFSNSQITNLTLSFAITISASVYDVNADGFSITSAGLGALTFAGDGIVNTSATLQNFVLDTDETGKGGVISFTNSATTSGPVNFTVKGQNKSLNSKLGTVEFHNNSSAGTAGFICEPGQTGGAGNGQINFFDSATAGTGQFTCEGSVVNHTSGGEIFFNDSSTAGYGVFTVNPSKVPGGSVGGLISFLQSATADHGMFTINGGDAEAFVSFFDTADAGDATFILNGADTGYGGRLYFYDQSTLGNSTIIINSGSGGLGGECIISGSHTTGAPTVTISGNGELLIEPAGGTVSIGSLAGEGYVDVIPGTLMIGANDRSTEFGGWISDSGHTGSLTKVGSGTLTLTGANTYSGATTILSGGLKVNNITGSATGTGAVKVSGGTLSGRGIISGKVTVGTGSATGGVIAPSKGANNPTTITLQDQLIIQPNGSYLFKLNTNKDTADQVIASGVTIKSGAQFNFNAVANKKLITGTVFTAIRNTAATPITGTFANLVDGSTVTIGVNKLQVSYSGGDGNDLTLTVVQ